MICVDHIGIAARDPLASARALAEILGTSEPAVDGADDDMYRIDLDGAFVLFNAADHVPPVHVAFRVDHAQFAAVVDRLHARQIPFGNDPEDTRNGRVDDPLGGNARLYFVDRDGHLFEVTS